MALVTLAALLLAAAPAAAAPKQSRPNVLVLMTDDQTLESMRVMPRVRRLLGEHGTTFDRSFVSFSLCCPSRSTLFTGQYAHNHGVLGNTPPLGGYQKLDKTNWLPLWLQRAGYRTVHLGKFLNGYGRDNPFEIPPGWSEWYGSVDPSTYLYSGYTLNENGILHTYEEYSTDLYSRRASELIARLAPSRRPFFLSVAFLAPHSGGPRDPDDPRNPATPSPAPRHRDASAAEPVPRPPSFNEFDVLDKPASIRRRPLLRPLRVVGIQEGYQQRLESLLAVDEGVSQIVAALRRSGELARTLILFTSDNGFFHGEHRVPAGKVLVYEPSIRVPLILRGPGVPEGAHRGQLVTNADLAPTILDAAGAHAGRIEDGRSLFPLLRGRGRQWGRDLFIEGGDGGPAPFDALRTYRYLYAEYSTGERELYDLRSDPDELQSLHTDPRYAPLVHRLSLRLAALRGCRGRACRARPHLGVHVHPRHRCATRVLRARVVGSGRSHVERADFVVKHRRVVSDRRAPFARRVPLRRVRPGHAFRLRAKLSTDDGRLLTVDRRSRRCP